MFKCILNFCKEKAVCVYADFYTSIMRKFIKLLSKVNTYCQKGFECSTEVHNCAINHFRLTVLTVLQRRLLIWMYQDDYEDENQKYVIDNRENYLFLWRFFIYTSCFEQVVKNGPGILHNWCWFFRHISGLRWSTKQASQRKGKASYFQCRRGKIWNNTLYIVNRGVTAFK